ncbi:YfgM family protein [Verrucosispora sioxanthis]|uniref:hypothetical protein n=1 Tax=Verrucosispora sioxanthis TaxID=2499994 RepID=UPI001AA012F3|nr:hypothetical protein [Verrucosispora sioxanthis]
MDHLALLEETLGAATTAGDYQRALTLTRAALDEVDTGAEPLRAARLLDRRGRMLAMLGKSDGATELREAYRLVSGVSDGPTGCGCSPTSPITWPASTTPTRPGSPPRW